MPIFFSNFQNRTLLEISENLSRSAGFVWEYLKLYIPLRSSCGNISTYIYLYDHRMGMSKLTYPSTAIVWQYLKLDIHIRLSCENIQTYISLYEHRVRISELRCSYTLRFYSILF